MISNNKEIRNTNSGIFHLLDLDSRLNSNKTDSIYIELKPNLKKEIHSAIIRAFGTITNLSNNINVNFTKLWDQINRCPFSLTVLKKITHILVKHGWYNLSLRSLEKDILYIKSGGSKSERLYQPRFPINFLTKEGMRFISHIYHDGSIGKRNKQPHYKNFSKEECREFLNDARKIFGRINRGLTKNKDKTYSVHLPTIIGEIIISIGYTPGDKTKQNPKTFKFLNDVVDNGLIAEFLSKAFNDDGYVGKRYVGLQQTSLIKNNEKKPSQILLLDKIFLEKLGIKVNGPNLTGIYKNRHGLCTNYSINIYSKENLRVFQKNIRLIKYKRIKLEVFLNTGYKLKIHKFINK